MAKKLWLRDGKLLVDGDGKPILCDECPCAAVDCSAKVQARVSAYLAELEPDGVTPKWHVVASYPSLYTCATIEYDPVEQEWNVVTPASGDLWVAFRNSPLALTGPGIPERCQIIEGTLLEDNDGSLKLVACDCNYTRSGVCIPRFETYDGFWVAGALPVQGFDASGSDNQAAVEAYNPCSLDMCEVLKLFMSAGQARWGGELTGEGYVEHNSVPCVPEATIRDAYYLQGWVFFWDDGTGVKRYANLLRCGCNEIVRHYDFNETREISDPSGSEDPEYTYEYRSLTGVCTSPCQLALTLAASAAANHQTLYHEGVLFPRDGRVIYDEGGEPDHYEWGDTYDFSHSSDFGWWGSEDGYWGAYPYLVCKDNGDGSFSLVSCDCDEILTIDLDSFWTEWVGEYPTDGKPIILPIEYSGACSCLDLREIIMAHTEDFGIVDASMGSNTIFQIANEQHKKAQAPDGTWYDTGLQPEHVCFKEGSTSYAGTADLLDYRSLCVIKDYGWRSDIYMLTPDKMEAQDVHGSISQALIQRAITHVAGSTSASYSFTGHMDLYTYRAALDDYYYLSVWYDPEDPQGDFPEYCDTGEMPVIWDWDGDHRVVVAVLRSVNEAKAWWVNHGYICHCEGEEGSCGSTQFAPNYAWGNPAGGPVPNPTGGYEAAGATTNRGFVLQGGGAPVPEVSIALCSGEDYTFATMTPRGEPECIGHEFIPPEEESDSGESESEE